jgi:hypothetical protein
MKYISRRPTGLGMIRLVIPEVIKMGFLDGVRFAGDNKRKGRFRARPSDRGDDSERIFLVPLDIDANILCFRSHPGTKTIWVSLLA